MQTLTKPEWKHDWRKEVGYAPSVASTEVFHSYVETAYKLLEESKALDLLAADVQKLGVRPQYLYQVLLDMHGSQLCMKLHTTEEGVRLLSLYIR